MDAVEPFIALMAQGGFAIAVSAFLLIRMEKELKQLREAVLMLSHILQVYEPFHGSRKTEEKTK